MKIGILVPSVYMHGNEFKKRISAPMDLSITLADALVDRGNEVLFFSGPDISTKAKVVEDKNLTPLTSKKKIDYQQDLSLESYNAVSFYETKKYFELDITALAYELAMQKKVDILHVYHAYGNLAHYFTELVKIPTIYTLHVKPPPLETLEAWRYARFKDQNFIAISQSQKKAFQALVPRMNIVDVIYHGVGLSKYSFDESGGDNLVFLGRLIPEKGLDIALKVSLRVGKIIEVATHLNNVIEETKYYKDEVEPLLNEQKVNSHDLLGLEDKVTLLKKSKTFLFPLQWDEPFGMVLIESMSCGTPIVAYARGSIPEIIIDGKTGFLVNPSDTDIRGDFIIKKTGIEGLIEAVNLLYSLSRDDYMKIRKNCRDLVVEKFSAEKMVENYEKVYEKVINENR